MPKVGLLLLGVVLVLMGGGPSMAQSPDDPAEAVRAFYAALFRAEEYNEFMRRACIDYQLPPPMYTEMTELLDGVQVDVSGMTFTTDSISEDGQTARVRIEGQPSVQASDGPPPEVYVPYAELEVWFQVDAWRPCPPERPARIVSAADMTLSESQARQTAIDFYAAFYTGDIGRVEQLTCAERRVMNTQGLRWSPFSRPGYAIAPSEWDITLIPDGPDFRLESTGTLELTFQTDTTVQTEDRLDFPNARLIRDGGWKFCGGYREPAFDIAQFARAYILPDSNGALAPVACRALTDPLNVASADYEFAVEDIVLTGAVFQDPDPTDDRAQAINLRGVVAQTPQGFISLAEVFGNTAELVYEAGRWQWCSLPPGADDPDETEE